MKTISTLIVALCFSLKVSAQAQEIEQLMLDIQKLTQFKSILADMKAGYQIYEQGYGSISNLSKGNFDLHNMYLTGLMAVSPTVRNYGRVADIISQQASLVSEYKRANSNFRQSGSFSADELSYMRNVYANLINQSLDNLDELNTLVTANKLRMSDADRIKGIDRIYSSGSDLLNFLRAFNRQGVLLSLQRAKDANDVNTLKKLYQ
jgi:hypothetical protein